MSRNLDHFFTANECAEIDTHLDNANLIVNEVEGKFNSNNEPLDESNQAQIAEKKEIDFKIQLIHILNRAVVGIKKINLYNQTLWNPGEIKSYIKSELQPLKSKIENFETTFNMNRENNLLVEETVEELRNEYDKISDELETIGTFIEKQNELNSEIMDGTINLRSMRSSTPHGEFSLIQANKNLKIPIKSYNKIT